MPGVDILFLFYLIIGASAGILSGLIGVGGGVIIVPSLAYIFQSHQLAQGESMHLAIGTSLAVMIVNTARSFMAHIKYKIHFRDCYFLLLPGVIVGTVGGAIAAHFLQSRTLSILFGISLVLVAVKMLFSNKHHEYRPALNRALTRFFGLFVGVTSSILGLGGGTFTVPYLTHFNITMRQAVVVAVITGLTIATIGAISFMIVGSFAVGMPKWSIGYVYLPAWLGVAVGGAIFAPIGAYWSHRIKMVYLRRSFAVFLLLVSIHMFFMQR